MKMKSKDTIMIAIAGLVALGFVGCSDMQKLAPAQSKIIAAKLATNTILKKGWAELPVPIYISQTVPEKFREACLHAMDMWNQEAGIQLFDYQGVTATETAADDGINAIYWDTKPSPNGYFGETHKSWVDDDVIIEADIMFYGNPDDFDALSCDNGKDACASPEKKKDITTTALHELGHVLGFVHTSEPDHLMNPNFTYGDVFQHFDRTLVSELEAVYNPIVVASE